MSDKKEYIEREAAFAALCEYCDGGACKDSGNSECAEYRKIRLIPAADVEVVRHGVWVEYWDDNYLSWSHKCSKCGNFPLTKDETMHDEVLSKYCPNCGAKMDGKGEGE